MANGPRRGAMRGTAVLCRGLARVCPVRYAITIGHPAARMPPVRGFALPQPETFMMLAILQFTAADAALTEELWGDRDLELETDDGRRFACLLLKSVTTDFVMWECGLNPCRPAPRTARG